MSAKPLCMTMESLVIQKQYGYSDRNCLNDESKIKIWAIEYYHERTLYLDRVLADKIYRNERIWHYASFMAFIFSTSLMADLRRVPWPTGKRKRWQ